jgi:hypothetical protein
MNYFGNHKSVAVAAVEEEFLPTHVYKLGDIVIGAPDAGTTGAAGDAFSGFNNLLNAVTSTWNLVKSIFSSSSKTAIVQSFTNLTFDELQSTCLIKSFVGIPPEKLDAFKQYIIRSVEVPAEKTADFNEMWDWAEFTTAGTWNYQNTAFTKDQ